MLGGFKKIYKLIVNNIKNTLAYFFNKKPGYLSYKKNYFGIILWTSLKTHFLF